MQKALTPQPTLQNGCFAGDTAEYAEEINIPLSSVSIGRRPLCNLRFPADINLLGGSEEELQQLTERLEKTEKQNSRQQRKTEIIYQHMDEWENAGRSGPVQIHRIHTN